MKIKAKKKTEIKARIKKAGSNEWTQLGLIYSNGFWFKLKKFILKLKKLWPQY